LAKIHGRCFKIELELGEIDNLNQKISIKVKYPISKAVCQIQGLNLRRKVKLSWL